MTNTALTTRTDHALTPYSDSARKYARKSKADNTIRAYKAALRDFEDWCHAAGLASFPAQPVAVSEYITYLADTGASISTIDSRLAAIAYFHRQSKQVDPVSDEDVRMVMAGIRRERGVAPAKKAPVTRAELKKMIACLPTTLTGKRDKAMLLIGFAGAFRRSELVNLEVADLRITDVMRITVRKSKTDQEGKGMVKVIPPVRDRMIDPLLAVREWLSASEITSGPLFRKIDRWGNVLTHKLTAQTVARLVKSSAKRAGLNERQFSGHSLRSGFITEAASAGVESRDIMAQTGHRSEAVMRGYIQDAGAGAGKAVRGAFGE